MSILNNLKKFVKYAGKVKEYGINEYTNFQFPNVYLKKSYSFILKNFEDYIPMIEYLQEQSKQNSIIEKDFIKYNIDLIKAFEIKQHIYLQSLKKENLYKPEYLEQLNLINDYSKKVIKAFSEYSNKCYLFETYKNNYKSLDEDELKSLIDLINEKSDNSPINPYILLNEYNSMVLSFETNVTNVFLNYIEEKNITFANQFKKILDEKNKEKSITSFLNIEVFEDSNIKSKFSFNQNEYYKNIWLFNDNSLLVKNKDNSLSVIKNDEDFEIIYKKLPENILSYSLRKNPQLLKIFSNKLNEIFNNSEMISLIETMETVLNNQQILKNSKFNFNELNNKSVEKFSDSMHECIRKHKVENYRKSIISNKYSHFLNESNYKYFETLYDDKVSKEDLQKYIGKKLAACKDIEMFNNSIKSLINIYNSFDKDILINKLKSEKMDTFYEKDNIIAFEIKNYEQCKKFGSQSWCIQRSENTFLNYTLRAKQIFVYDFNKEVNDTQSMFGITIYNNGDIYTQHFKDDTFFKVSDYPIANDIYNEVLTKLLNKNELNENSLEIISKLENKKQDKKIKMDI